VANGQRYAMFECWPKQDRAAVQAMARILLFQLLLFGYLNLGLSGFTIKMICITCYMRDKPNIVYRLV
jgi:hypothetical protein